ncbi:MAG: hypothetical protein KDB21_14905 [Acidimicrobiales bacterium]|nr:hypothetical protein [Acidimicrobiales bacterium]
MPFERPPGVWRAITGACAAAALGWPALDYVPRAALDPSWQLGLSLAHHENVSFGEDVVFNYGPLGFVTVPNLAGGWLFGAALAGTFALLVVTGAALYATARLHERTPLAAAALTGIALVVAPTNFGMVEVVLAAVVALLLSLRWRSESLPPPIWAAGGALAAVLFLIKVSAGPFLFFAMLMAAVVDRRRIVAVATTFAAFMIFLVAGWLACGQSLGDLPTWIRGTTSVIAGHTAAMTIEAPGTAWEYLALAVVGVTGAIAVGLTVADPVNRGPDRRGVTAACVVIGAASTWFVFKQGFVRHDTHSMIFFFAVGLWLVFLLPWRALSERALHAGLVATAVALATFVVVSSGSLWSVLDPAPSISSLARGVNLVIDGDDRTAELDRARAAIVAEYAIPQTMIDAIGDAPVHVDPTDVSAVWAYGLRWQPMATLQRYVGYTPYLDERNADSMSDGPEYVLMRGAPGIDARFALAEIPLYMRSLLCDFAPDPRVEPDERWMLLRRDTTSRCGELTQVATHEVAAGEPVTVPGPSGDRAALLVAIDADGPGVLGWPIAQLHRPRHTPSMTIDGVTYRMIAATAGTPALLYVPPASGWNAASRVLIDAPGSLSVSSRASITFYELELRSGE